MVTGRVRTLGSLARPPGREGQTQRMPELEEQYLAMTGNGYAGDGSPDRLDAAVWALTELMGAPTPGIIEWTRSEALVRCKKPGEQFWKTTLIAFSMMLMILVLGSSK
jgi:hypothetical protein